MPYDLQSIKAPRLAGLSLSTAAALLDSGATRGLLVPSLLKNAGIDRFRAASFPDAPSVAPMLPHPASLEGVPFPSMDLDALALGAPVGPGFRFESATTFAIAYREGHTTPEAVARRVIAALKASNAQNPPLRAVIAWGEENIMAQAWASGQRFREGRPLSPLDGVPVAIKDEIDVVSFPTTAGTRFLRTPAAEDATVVARLRAAGAIIIGKANMHEIGIDTWGFNQHHGTPRNPYDPSRYTGGSSSGSAAAVAAGLCPVAIGADGGGSIRIPAALCGVAGIKPTWGRVSEAGAFPLCWSVAHVGPIAATVRDLVLSYAIIAGPDPRDPNSQQQPPLRFDGLGQGALNDLRIGVYMPWFEHASGEIVTQSRELLNQLRDQGATIVELEIPDLEWGRLAHAITILSEMATAMEQYDDEHRGDYSPGVRVNLALARQMNNRDYVKAQQVRTRLTANFRRAFESVDAIITPTTATTAPSIPSDALRRGESNLDVTSALMRFVFPSNLTGHPAISVPAGYDSKGLPIGAQFIGRPWEEHVLFRLGEAVEYLVERRAPKVHFSLLRSEQVEQAAVPGQPAVAGV